MLYHLLTPYARDFILFNLFTYISFRAAGAAATAVLLAFLTGPAVIRQLRTRGVGQIIRAEGPATHQSKRGTPTMGGLLILLCTLVPTLLWAPLDNRYVLVALAATLWMGAIGFLDDFVKLTHRRSLGLSGRWKLLLLAGVTVVVAVVSRHLHLSTDVYVPIADVSIPLSWGWYAFLFLIIAGASNGTNLADGVDGLAAGAAIIALFTFTAMNVVPYVRSSPVPAPRNPTELDLPNVRPRPTRGPVGFPRRNHRPPSAD